MINEKWKNNIHNQGKGKGRTSILQLNPLNIKKAKNIPTQYIRKESQLKD